MENETSIYLLTPLTTSFAIGPLSGALGCLSSDSFAFDLSAPGALIWCSYTRSLLQMGISWSFHSWIKRRISPPCPRLVPRTAGGKQNQIIRSDPYELVVLLTKPSMSLITETMWPGGLRFIVLIDSCPGGGSVAFPRHQSFTQVPLVFIHP